MTTLQYKPEDVVGVECRFAIHIPAKPEKDLPDVHMIKEQISLNNGQVIPNVRLVTGFTRPYWIAKQSTRNYRDKKEWEKEENLLKKQCTQSQLRDEIANQLNVRGRTHIKALCASPYVYGSDITSTSIIKKLYMDKYPNVNTGYSVATFDIETDVVHGTKEAILATLAFKNKIYLVALRSFFFGFANTEEQIMTAARKYIGEYIEKRGLEIEIYIAENVVDLIRAIFTKAHEWKPDFLSIWNMNYDIPEVLRILKENHVDPKDILCDPSVPKEFRVCNYKPGPDKKTTASGKVMPINPAARWHTFYLTASFYVIDQMCAYKHIRMTKQEETSYSLDAILNKELGIRKLKFQEADAYSGLAWHQFMQTNYKVEYAVYNIFDSYSMIELDEKTKDLSHTLAAFSASSDFSLFRSQPRRIVDALHFFLLERGYVLGTVGSAPAIAKPATVNDTTEEGETEDSVAEFDSTVNEEEEAAPEDTTLDLRNWVITLPAHMSVLGSACILEDQLMRTGIRAFVYDSDAVSAYPTCISIANVSKETTKRELISIEGIDEDVFRMQNINLVAGSTNALEYCASMFNLPEPEELLKKFIAE